MDVLKSELLIGRLWKLPEPSVLISVHGGPATLQDVLQHLVRGLPVVLLPETGGATEALGL